MHLGREEPGRAGAVITNAGAGGGSSASATPSPRSEARVSASKAPAAAGAAAASIAAASRKARFVRAYMTVVHAFHRRFSRSARALRVVFDWTRTPRDRRGACRAGRSAAAAALAAQAAVGCGGG